MSVSGLCEICQSADVEDGCDRCGRVVCADHYDPETGFCTDCLAEFGERPSDGRDESDYPDGVEEYRF
jgi:hypothetical protein